MPASETALTTCLKNGISVLVASSAENSTLTPKLFAYATMSADCLSICSLVRWSLCWRWMSDEARKTWTPFTPQLIAVSMSTFSALARPETSALRPAFAILRTPSCSPFEVIGNPASMTSTPSLSSASAISSFSSGVSETPGVCSPSRRVVSSTRIILSLIATRSPLGAPRRRSSRCRGRSTPSLSTNSSICLR